MSLNVVYEPVESECTLDIVAVPGLRCTVVGTWTHPKSKAFWLRDFLPGKLPGARILTFDYDAPAAFGGSYAQFRRSVISLLDSLVVRRTMDEDRPIIFIAHSLGGILAKEALLGSSQRIREYGSIKNATTGILFFGTPHRKSDYASYADVLATVAKVQSPNDHQRTLSVEGLRKKSYRLKRLTSHFVMEFPRLRTISFYELRPTSPLDNLAVERSSALLDIAHETTEPVDADHNQICTFEEESEVFFRVLGHIKSMAPEHRKSSVKQPAAVNPLETSAISSGKHSVRTVQSELDTNLKHASGPMSLSSADLDSDRYDTIISIFAVKIVDRLTNLDHLDKILDLEEAQLIVQENLQLFSDSLEWEDRDHRLHLQTQMPQFFRKHGLQIAKEVCLMIDRRSFLPVVEEAPHWKHAPIPRLERIHGHVRDGSFAISSTDPEGIQNDSDSESLPEMVRYFTSTESFGWLIQRVQTFVSRGRGDSLHEVSAGLLSVLEETLNDIRGPRTSFSFDCDLKAYLKAAFDGHVPLASLICVNAYGATYEASTLGEYMARMWPTTGIQFLGLLQEWTETIIDEDEVGRGIQVKRAVTNGEVSVASLGPFLDVDVTGPIYLMLEIGEQLAWLGCVCRIADASDGMTLVRPIVSRAYSYPDRLLRPPVSLYMSFQSLEHPAEHAKDGTCWRKLFRNICVADGFATNFRRGEELGLELPFDMMAQLGGAHRAAYWDGRLVLKGFETLFVPVKKAGGCISWHLVTKANRRRISFNTAGDLGELGEQQVHIEDLLSSRHFLGWVPRASQHAGTQDGNYDSTSDVYLDSPGRGLVLSGVSVTMSKIVGMGATFTLGPAQRGIRTSSTTQFFADVVDKMTKIHVLLYDHQCARGWLLDGASALLHILRFHVANYKPIRDCGAFDLSQFCYADSRVGSDAAKDVLLNPQAQDIVLLMERSRREKESVEQSDGDLAFKTIIETDVRNCLLKDRVLDMWDILEQMYDRWKGKKEQNGLALSGFKTQLEGWKFQDVVDREHSINPVVAELDDSAKDWIRLIRHIDAVVLFGNGFGELMRPMGEHCVNWTAVPQKKFCLAVPVSQLRRIARKHGRPDETPIKLAEDVYWPIVEHPFECRCGITGSEQRRACDRSQTLRYNKTHMSKNLMGSEVLSDTDNDNGAVIFGGRKLHKSLGERMHSAAGGASQQPNTGSDDHSGTGVIRKMREFLKRRL